MINFLLSKGTKETDTIIFKIYKSGIDNERKKQFEEEELKKLEEKSYFYEDKSIYSQLCEEYWKNTFDEWNLEFKNAFKLNENYKIVENSEICRDDYIEIYWKNIKYTLVYDYEIIEDETIIIYFKLYREKNLKEYDEAIEEIKLKVKNFWIKKTKDKNCRDENCYWIEDTQSEYLSSQIYPIINKIENRLRSLINRCMIYSYGLSWSDIFDKETKIKNKYLQRYQAYKKDINIFSNVNIFLLSLDSNDLIEIMNYKKSEINKEKMIDIISKIEEINIIDNQNFNDDICELKSMAYEYKYKIDVWNTCFRSLFEYYKPSDWIQDDIYVSSNFLVEWGMLCKYRNHIAHNKFIDYELYNKIFKLSSNVDIKIEEAEKEFNCQISDNYMKDVEVSDQLTPWERVTLKYFNRFEREYEIYKQITFLIKRIKKFEYNSNVTLCLNESFDFDEIYKDVNDSNFEKIIKMENKGAILFLQHIIENGFIEIINIEDNLKASLVQIKIDKCKGNYLTNYIVEVKFKNNKELRTTIGHNEYEFIVNGCPENCCFIGGEWNTFCSNVEHEILKCI